MYYPCKPILGYNITKHYNSWFPYWVRGQYQTPHGLFTYWTSQTVGFRPLLK